MYSTIPNLKAKYPRIENTQVGSDTLIKWINFADGIIDAYITNVITLPMSITPPIIEGISTDIAYSKFMQRHSKEADKDASLNSIYEDALSLLDGIRNGTLSLVSSAGADLTSGTKTPVMSESGYVPTFNTGLKPSEWREDPQKRKDALDEVYYSEE